MTAVAILGCTTEPAHTSRVERKGSVQQGYYVHSSGLFRVGVEADPQISEWASGVRFTHYAHLGAFTSEHVVAFLSPKFYSGKTLREIVQGVVTDTAARIYKGKKAQPSILSLSEESKVLGRTSYLAKVLFPEVPGSGLTVCCKQGRFRDADFIGHLQLVPIWDLNIGLGGGRVEYLAVVSIVVTFDPDKDDGGARHNRFVERLELLAQ